MSAGKVILNVVGRAVRETGQAMDRLGLTIAASKAYETTLSRHRKVMPVNSLMPQTGSAFVAPTANVIGNVSISSGGSVWYSTVLRADQAAHHITIGENSNVQDRSVLAAHGGSISIGNDVTIGHGALIEGNVRVGDQCLIGQGCILGADVTVEGGSIIAAGAVVLPRTTVPAGQMWAGNPAAFVRAVKPAEAATFQEQATHYVQLADQHAKEF
jgi:gamma-carbonic anhydrase